MHVCLNIFWWLQSTSCRIWTSSYSKGGGTRFAVTMICANACTEKLFLCKLLYFVCLLTVVWHGVEAFPDLCSFLALQWVAMNAPSAIPCFSNCQQTSWWSEVNHQELQMLVCLTWSECHVYFSILNIFCRPWTISFLRHTKAHSSQWLQIEILEGTSETDSVKPKGDASIVIDSNRKSTFWFLVLTEFVKSAYHNLTRHIRGAEELEMIHNIFPYRKLGSILSPTILKISRMI